MSRSSISERGDVLFRIDRARYDIALRQVEAVLVGKRAMPGEANADLARCRSASRNDRSDAKGGEEPHNGLHAKR